MTTITKTAKTHPAAKKSCVWEEPVICHDGTCHDITCHDAICQDVICHDAICHDVISHDVICHDIITIPLKVGNQAITSLDIYPKKRAHSQEHTGS